MTRDADDVQAVIDQVNRIAREIYTLRQRLDGSISDDEESEILRDIARLEAQQAREGGGAGTRPKRRGDGGA